jgi:hypothetical protein
VLTVLRVCFKPTFLADHRSYLRLMHESANRLEGIHAADKSITGEGRGLAYALMPDMPRVRQIHVKMQADIRITRTGLALLASKADRGALPQTLAGFEPDDVRDPFSSAPLIYRPGAEGFVLYSIGPDKKDNGGSPKQDKQEEDWDIVWRFPGQADALSHQPKAGAPEQQEAEQY